MLQVHRKRTRHIDRISRLPDAILCHILSFLPTKDAAVTSILSTKWKYLWTQVTTFKFDDQSGKSNSVTPFVNFVDRALILHNDSIKKFSLQLVNSYDSFHVNAWICAAVMHNVEELQLRYRSPMKNTIQPLPHNLFRCQTLVVLRLSGEIVLDKVPDSVCFSSLKILYLESLRKLNEASIRKLLSGSPALEELVTDSHIDDGMQRMHIISSSLKKLKIKDKILGSAVYSAIVDAPKLEVLNLTYLYSKCCSFLKFPSLIKATVSVYDCVAVELLRQISNVKFLNLLVHLSLREDLHLLHDFNMPHLFHLKLTISCTQHVIWDILIRSPNLEFFHLHKQQHEHAWSVWNHPPPMPHCLKSLKMVELSGYEGCAADKEMAKYILKNATALKKMKISFSCRTILGEKCSILEDLLMFPRASRSCKIQIKK